MITRLTLKHWKSFGSASLWIDPLTFIIGTNSAGKSNIVDALAFLSQISGGKRLSDVEIRGGIEGLIERNRSIAELGLELKIGDVEFIYEISFSQEGKEILWTDEKLKIKNKEEETLFYTEIVDGGKAILWQRLGSEGGFGESDGVRRDISALSQLSNQATNKDLRYSVDFVSEAIKSIFVLDPKPERMRDYVPLSEKLLSDGSNTAGVIAALPEEKKNEFETTLTEYVRPLPDKDLYKIWAETVGRFKTDAMLYCAEEWVDGQISEFDARSMSDGTLRFIAIIVALLTARPGSTIVIEEVDGGLHPSRAGELVSALRVLSQAKKVDVICTTHNPVLIDALGPEMLPFISYVTRSEETGRSEIHLLEEVPHLLKLLANYSPGDIMTLGLLSEEKQ